VQASSFSFCYGDISDSGRVARVASCAGGGANAEGGGPRHAGGKG
jgi:hypothetical protein